MIEAWLLRLIKNAFALSSLSSFVFPINVRFVNGFNRFSTTVLKQAYWIENYSISSRSVYKDHFALDEWHLILLTDCISDRIRSQSIEKKNLLLK